MPITKNSAVQLPSAYGNDISSAFLKGLMTIYLVTTYWKRGIGILDPGHRVWVDTDNPGPKMSPYCHCSTGAWELGNKWSLWQGLARNVPTRPTEPPGDFSPGPWTALRLCIQKQSEGGLLKIQLQGQFREDTLCHSPWGHSIHPKLMNISLYSNTRMHGYQNKGIVMLSLPIGKLGNVCSSFPQI